jgi:ABC transporter substrate binding protein
MAARGPREQGEKMRRIGVLMPFAADDPEAKARLTAFHQGLQQLGWTDGRNVRIDIRWGAGEPERIRRYATELVALAPDVILASTTPAMGELQQATRTIPIVFVQVVDPVAAGFVDSLARPGSNVSGFTPFEYGISGKWLKLLKRDRARRHASGRHSRSGDIGGHRPVGDHPVRGTRIWSGVDTGRRARRRRDRARHHDIRSLLE